MVLKGSGWLGKGGGGALMRGIIAIICLGMDSLYEWMGMECPGHILTFYYHQICKFVVYFCYFLLRNE